MGLTGLSHTGGGVHHLLPPGPAVPRLQLPPLGLRWQGKDARGRGSVSGVNMCEGDQGCWSSTQPGQAVIVPPGHPRSSRGNTHQAQTGMLFLRQ